MKTIKILGEYDIVGHGKVFSADRREHDFELLDLKGHSVKINDEVWTVTGIERTCGIVPGPIVGLLVKKTKQVCLFYTLDSKPAEVSVWNSLDSAVKNFKTYYECCECGYDVTCLCNIEEDGEGKYSFGEYFFFDIVEVK